MFRILFEDSCFLAESVRNNRKSVRYGFYWTDLVEICIGKPLFCQTEPWPSILAKNSESLTLQILRKKYKGLELWNGTPQYVPLTVDNRIFL